MVTGIVARNTGSAERDEAEAHDAKRQPMRLQGDKSFYTAKALAARARLRLHTHITTEIDKFWTIFVRQNTALEPAAATTTQTVPHAGAAVSAPVKSVRFNISKSQYLSLHHLICKVIWQHDYNFKEACQLGEKEWRKDCSYEESLTLAAQRRRQSKETLTLETLDSAMMSKSAFFRALFEVADQWTLTIKLEDYIQFLRELYISTTKPLSPSEPGIRIFKELSDIDLNYLSGYAAPLGASGAASIIQRVWRRHRHRRRHGAASKIQIFYRERRDALLRSMRRREEAARVIQQWAQKLILSPWRVERERIRLKKLREAEMLRDLSLQQQADDERRQRLDAELKTEKKRTRAAICIQRWMRALWSERRQRSLPSSDSDPATAEDASDSSSAVVEARSKQTRTVVVKRKKLVRRRVERVGGGGGSTVAAAAASAAAADATLTAMLEDRTVRDILDGTDGCADMHAHSHASVDTSPAAAAHSQNDAMSTRFQCSIDVRAHPPALNTLFKTQTHADENDSVASTHIPSSPTPAIVSTRAQAMAQFLLNLTARVIKRSNAPPEEHAQTGSEQPPVPPSVSPAVPVSSTADVLASLSTSLSSASSGAARVFARLHELDDALKLLEHSVLQPHRQRRLRKLRARKDEIMARELRRRVQPASVKSASPTHVSHRSVRRRQTKEEEHSATSIISPKSSSASVSAGVGPAAVSAHREARTLSHLSPSNRSRRSAARASTSSIGAGNASIEVSASPERPRVSLLRRAGAVHANSGSDVRALSGVNHSSASVGAHGVDVGTAGEHVVLLRRSAPRHSETHSHNHSHSNSNTRTRSIYDMDERHEDMLRPGLAVDDVAHAKRSSDMLQHSSTAGEQIEDRSSASVSNVRSRTHDGGVSRVAARRPAVRAPPIGRVSVPDEHAGNASSPRLSASVPRVLLSLDANDTLQKTQTYERRTQLSADTAHVVPSLPAVLSALTPSSSTEMNESDCEYYEDPVAARRRRCAHHSQAHAARYRRVAACSVAFTSI